MKSKVLAELKWSTTQPERSNEGLGLESANRERLSLDDPVAEKRLHEELQSGLEALGAAFEILESLDHETSTEALEHLTSLRQSLTKSLTVMRGAGLVSLEFEFRLTQVNRHFSRLEERFQYEPGHEPAEFNARRFWAVADCGGRLLDELALACATDPVLLEAARVRTLKRLEESLRIRRAIAELRLTVEDAAEDSRYELSLRRVATAVARFLGGGAHRQIRYLDRQILFAFQRRVRECLASPTEPYIRALISDALSMVTLLSEVRYREELLARDSYLLARLPQTLPENQTAEFRSLLQELYGVSSVLDRCLAEDTELSPASYGEFLAEANSTTRTQREDPSL